MTKFASIADMGPSYTSEVKKLEALRRDLESTVKVMNAKVKKLGVELFAARKLTKEAGMFLSWWNSKRNLIRNAFAQS